MDYLVHSSSHFLSSYQIEIIQEVKGKKKRNSVPSTCLAGLVGKQEFNKANSF